MVEFALRQYLTGEPGTTGGTCHEPASPAPPTGSASSTTDSWTKIFENVATNLITLAAIPAFIALTCLVCGLALHIARRDLRAWWEAVHDFQRLAGPSEAGGMAGLRYWLALIQVLVTGRLADASVLRRNVEK